MSKCESCANLTVWPGVFGGARYLCEVLRPSPKQFGKFGFPAKNGYPPVITCDKYKEGRHYSLRDLLRTRENRT